MSEPALRYIIMPNRQQGGVCLSLCGSWGNLPYPDAAAARAAAEANAGTRPRSIESKGFR